MDREILFRGKRIDNGEYIQGFYAKSGDKELILIDNDILVGYVKAKEVIPETLCQYTGLKDKNGTKIFEGDILYLKTGKGWTCGEGVDVYYKVIFTEFNEECRSTTEYIGYMAENKDGSLYSIEYIVRVDGAEVIGNIWDNPELLENNND